ncbi:Uncharacterised protein [Klebsiella michiganensis]|uniref:Uncharacterized protein n=1 Tax=Klebsiella michiganensis TaxID=1134687 RepID=A0A7H4PJB2_9ENTR|nr:Uncharacterised protein [Klebsiella michiganensis]
MRVSPTAIGILPTTCTASQVKQRPLFMGQLRHFGDREKHPGFRYSPTWR